MRLEFPPHSHSGERGVQPLRFRRSPVWPAGDTSVKDQCERIQAECAEKSITPFSLDCYTGLAVGIWASATAGRADAPDNGLLEQLRRKLGKVVAPVNPGVRPSARFVDGVEAVFPE